MHGRACFRHKVVSSLGILCLLTFGLSGTPATADDAQLAAVGSLAAAHVYTSYGYVGVVADAFVAKSFSADQVVNLMTETTDMINLNMESLRKVRPTLASEDQAFIDLLIHVYELVKCEARALTDFARTEKPEYAAEFEKARTAVWPHLKQVLSLN